jgi:sugar fermentation stimulation protein A
MDVSAPPSDVDGVCLVPFGRPVRRGRLVRRYKRFFADVVLDDDLAITAHTASTGAMTGLLDEGNGVLVTRYDSPTRKLPFGLEAIHVGTSWVGVNTSLPNTFVASAIERGLVPGLPPRRMATREVKYGAEGRSRCDLVLHDEPLADTGARRDRCYVEVKSVTMRDGAAAVWPDAVSARGLKHLEELVDVVEAGGDAAMIFVALRTDCAVFAPAWGVDRAYGDALVRAAAAGVHVACLIGRVDERGLAFAGTLPIDLSAR